MRRTGAFILALLGYNRVRNYDGSMGEWANRDHTALGGGGVRQWRSGRCDTMRIYVEDGTGRKWKQEYCH